MIITITDGSRLTHSSGVQEEVREEPVSGAARAGVLLGVTDPPRPSWLLPVPPQLQLPLHSPLPGSELTKEPFRWDQRLFALVLRLPGAAVPDSEQLGSVPSDESAITQMCEVTGGTSRHALPAAHRDPARALCILGRPPGPHRDHEQH